MPYLSFSRIIVEIKIGKKPAKDQMILSRGGNRIGPDHFHMRQTHHIFTCCGVMAMDYQLLGRGLLVMLLPAA